MLGRLSPGERLVLVAGIALIADLVLLPWHSVDLGPLNLRIDTTRSGVESPNAAYGIGAALLTALMVAQIAIGRMTAARLPDPPLPWSQLQLVAGVFVAVLLAFKLLRETAYLGYGAYSGILASLLVAYGGYTIAREGDAAR